MPLPVFPLLVIAGIGTTGYALRGAAQTLESGSRLAKWGVYGGALYVSFVALKGAGVIK